MDESAVYQLLITGIVQGVGFRPFVYRLANSLEITGYVLNNSKGVRIVARATDSQLAFFREQLARKAPEHARVDTIDISLLRPDEKFDGFEIRESEEQQGRYAGISPDLPVCEHCLSELLNPADRRFYYPFINCTHCGPRYTITRGVPYDRARTTMAGFAMCPVCRAEYNDPRDRRFHAQPNACHTCGPHLDLTDNRGKVLLQPRDAAAYRQLFKETAGLLRNGSILAVKGIGGYHLACHAGDPAAVARLRERKYREDKPFAVMCSDVARAAGFVSLGREEQVLLLSAARPIVLLKKISVVQTVAEAVAPGNRHLGIMLPYTPLHRLLFHHIDFPLVMTSANVSEEPIAFINEEAVKRLTGICDYFIRGDRDIYIRCDDTVTRQVHGQAYVLRRSRGIVPLPVLLERESFVPVLGLGAEQKNTVCLSRGRNAFLSHHIGDLKNLPAMDSFRQAIGHLCTILDTKPALVACDLHPGYLNTRFVREPPPGFQDLAGLPLAEIQHHQAHIAACMAENGVSTPVIGIALDGTGMGSDGNIWGGEVFTVRDYSFTRIYSLAPVVMPGGDMAVKKPWRMACAYLYKVYGSGWREYLPGSWQNPAEDELAIIEFQCRQPGFSPLTSSCGRLFDAVSALAGIRLESNYEGQAAVELEQASHEQLAEGYTFDLLSRNDGPGWIIWQEMIRQVCRDLARDDVNHNRIATRFHAGLVDILVKACHSIRSKSSITGIVLSGGCFMNMLLLLHLCRRLEKDGFSVYTHRQVPCNDGGIALGQVVLAEKRMRGE